MYTREIDYISTLRQVFSGHWIERFENTGKTHRPSFEKIVAGFKSFFLSPGKITGTDKT